MFRSSGSFNRIEAVVALVVLLALGVGAYALSRPQKAIPVTAAANVVNSHRSLDLGAGYRLEMNGDRGQIIAPAVNIKPAAKTIELGAGYRLVLNGTEGKIIAPVRPATTYRRMDLGGGYVLELNGDSGQITAPVTTLKNQPTANQAQTPAVNKIDIGSGYWLVIGPDGGQIINGGSR